jgi:CheY-like chemotaxis protein
MDQLPASWQKQRSSYRILIIEDDANFRQFLSELLIVTGFDVVNAANGEIGLQAFDLHIPDIVITDIVMAGMDGLEVIRRLKDKSAAVPIIAMAGSNADGRGDGFLSLALMRGADAVISKPFNLDDMRATLSRLINEKLSNMQQASQL